MKFSIPTPIVEIVAADGIAIVGAAIQSAAPHTPLPLEVVLYGTSGLFYVAAVALVGSAANTIRKAVRK